MPIARRDPIRLSVAELTQAGEVRRTIASLAAALAFDERHASAASIVATELAMNLARHATGGEAICRSLHDGDRVGIEVLCVDRGPGIADVRTAMRDGFSTAGTPGTGLGAVRRLSDAFDVSSTPGKGTVVVARLWATPTTPGTRGRGDCDVGVVSLPKRGEPACGDAWAVAETGGGRTMVIVADGLGHGLQAADASRLAVRLFHDHVHLAPGQILERLHAGLRSTRGAAVSIVELRRGQQAARFAGVGNVASMLIGADGKLKTMVAHNGTVGAEMRRVQEFDYPCPPDALLLMHSDGVASQWQLGHYPGLRARTPSVIAGVIYRDYRRERDDVTVLALGDCEPPTP